MEKGFYHPERGYWQTIGDADVSHYPEGTVEIPIKPGKDMDWNGTEWVASQIIQEELDAAQQLEQERIDRILKNREKIAEAIGMSVDELKESLGLG